MSKVVEKLTSEFEEMLQQDVIGDKTVKWQDCVDILENIASYCQDWADQIRRDHKGDQ